MQGQCRNAAVLAPACSSTAMGFLPVGPAVAAALCTLGLRAGAQLRVSALAHGSEGRALGSAPLRARREGDVGALGERSPAGSAGQGWHFQQRPLSPRSPGHLGARSDVHSPPAPSSARPARPGLCLLLAVCRPRGPGSFLLLGCPRSTQPDLQTRSSAGLQPWVMSPRGRRWAHI